MALVLRPPAGGGAGTPAGPLNNTLLDPHGGQGDLAARQLRFLHPDSLRDDPSRVVRAARYGARLGMDLEPGSREQLRAVLAAWPWRLGVPAMGTRLRRELELLLAREPWPKALALLQGWGGLALLHAQLQADPHWHRRLQQASRLVLQARLPPRPPEEWLLLALVARLDDPLPLAERLQLSHRGLKLLMGFLQLRAWLQTQEAANQASSPSRLSLALERNGFTPEMVVLALVSGPVGTPAPRWRRGLLRWLLRWRTIASPRSARGLIGQGLEPGPQLGKELERLRCDRLDLERW
jgi:poly(A) polymerase